MNRGQVKRLRKELDRLQNGGKEWDALRLLEREHAIDEFRPVWDDLWRAQTRHAVRTAALMDQFLQRISEFSTVPDTPDIRFIRTVGDYLGGGNCAPGISSVTGLSAPVEALRRELLRQGGENTGDDAKLRKLLTLFAVTPEKVLQKDYRQLRVLLAPYPALSQRACEALEEILTRARKLNNASSVEFKAHGVYGPNLRALDMDLNKAAGELPPAFSRVVVAPVLAQVCVALRRVAESNPDKGARLALAAPFCMEKLAGSGWPELRKKFQLEAAQEFSDADLASLQKTARNATFEERFVLANKLLKIMSSQQDFDPDLQEILIFLFKGIFKELTTRRTKISDRDQRRLAAVFGPFFSKSKDFLYGGIEDLPFLLDSAAAAGCLDTVSALLHTFFAVMLRDRAMIANARSMLKLLSPMQERDVRDLFDQYREFLAEDLKALKGMLDICRECGHELDADVARGLELTFLSGLIMNTLLGGDSRNSFMTMVMGPMAAESAQLCKRLIKGMECFSDNPLFFAPVTLARSFPSGRISGKEFGHYLEKQIDTTSSTDQAISGFILILETIRQVSGKQRRDMPFGGALNGDSLIKELLGAGLEVLCGKKEQVMRHSTASLTVLVDIVRKYGDGRGCERYMQLIGNTAADRGVSGDEAAAKLYENTIDYIVRAIKPEKKKGRRR